MPCKSSLSLYDILQCFLLSLLLSLFAAYLQAGFGRDYANYLKIYNGIVQDPFGTFMSYEPGFKMLVYLCGFFGLEWFSTAILILWLSIACKLFFFKKHSPFFFASLLLYFVSFFLLHEATQVRTSIATSFLFFAIAALSEERLKSFFALMLGASLFHYSALLFISILLIYYSSKRRCVNPFSLLLLMVVLGFATSLFLRPALIAVFPNDEIYEYLPQKIGAYLTYRTDTPFNAKKLLLLGAVLFLFVVSYKEKFYLSLRTVCYYSFSLCAFLIFGFHQLDVIVDRLSELLLVPLVIFLPTYLSKKSEFRKLASVIFLAVVLYFPVYFWKIKLFQFY